ncbi:ribulose-phosphate 3-epimerase [Enterococcus olivae]
MKKVVYSPSIMCGDLVNLEKSIREIEAIKADSLHIDVIDSSFSPSMPLGLETVKRIREVTDMHLDVHVMSVDNEYFVKEISQMNMDSITFHYETSLHVDRYINLIKNSGAKVGIALNPATSLSVLEFILPQVDMVCLMLINPGFATDKNEKQIPYAVEKIKRLKQMIDEQGLDVEIQVDGRVSLEAIPRLIEAGAENLVLGSTSLFIKGNSLQENKKQLDEIVAAVNQ